jgi:adenylosuccinate lyase
MSLTAVSPLDGRYYTQVQALAPYFSEYALMRYRLQVEIAWLTLLAERPELPEVRAMSEAEQQLLQHWLTTFDTTEAQQIKAIEATTRHDVKAVEYYLKARLRSTSLADLCEWVHFGCTSEDISNLAYALLLKDGIRQVWLPLAQRLIHCVAALAQAHAAEPMLTRTHGQPASPSTLGKELAVFVSRWQRQLHHLEQATYLGKCNGAVGSYNAHAIAYPGVPWEDLSRTFVERLGLTWNPLTTQIEAHDFMAELFHILLRFHTIAINFSRDMWAYISLGYFRQAVVEYAVGSSTMPHKVNPIHFENAEANLGLSNTLLQYLAGTLPISRLQRDLTDSSTLRNIGSACAYAVVALHSLLEGLAQVSVDREALQADLDTAWEVLAEAIQTVMRKCGHALPYEQLKNLTRGRTVSREDIRAFVESLTLPADDKARLLALTPTTYTGLASQLVRYIHTDGSAALPGSKSPCTTLGHQRGDGSYT